MGEVIQKSLNKYLPKAGFIRSVLILMSGTAFAQIISFAFSPVLTRLYTPEDFGVLATFLSIGTILGTIMAGRYDMSIMLPKEHADSKAILKLIFALSFCLLIVISGSFLFFDSFLLNLLKENKLTLPLLFSVVLYAFIITQHNASSLFYIKVNQIRKTSGNAILKALLVALIQIGSSYFFDKNGLIYGQFFGWFFVTIIFLKPIFKDILAVPFEQVKQAAVKYIEFPKFSLPASLLNVLSLELNNVVIIMLFTASELGYFALAFRVLGLPISLIGKSFSQIYFKSASEERQKKGHAKSSFLRSFKLLFFLSLVGFGAGFFLIEDTFAIIFGEEWRTAGLFAKILMPLFAVRLVSTSLSNTTSVFEKQKIGLIINIILFFGLLSSYVIQHLFELNFFSFLKVYVSIQTPLYLSFIYLYFLIATKK